MDRILLWAIENNVTILIKPSEEVPDTIEVNFRYISKTTKTLHQISRFITKQRLESGYIELSERELDFMMKEFEKLSL